MLAVFNANVVSHYPNLMVSILQFGAQRFWGAQIKSEIENFRPAPGLNPYPSNRKSVTLSSPVVKYMCMLYFGSDT